MPRSFSEMGIYKRIDSMRNLLIILPVITFMAISCSKSKEQKKIIGVWEYQYFTHYDDNRTITWTFADDQTITQYSVVDNYADTVVATYSVDANLGDAYYVTIKGIDTDNDGKYQILKLNKKFLIMQRVEQDGQTGGAFIRKEFVKK